MKINLFSIIRSFNTNQKRIAVGLALTIVISSGVLIWHLFLQVTTIAPAPGGSIREGIVGVPKFVNPILASSPIDQDLSRLVYSGLLRKTAYGTYMPDLADSCLFNKNSTRVVCTLKPNITFHDGTPLSAADIVFTVERIQQLGVHSSVFLGKWAGVRAELITPNQVAFHLQKPFRGFEDALTVGILPKHIWGNIEATLMESSQYNLSPVGSGPYKWSTIQVSSDGTAKYIKLSRFSGFVLGTPHIESITVIPYVDQFELSKALQIGNVDSGVLHTIPDDMSGVGYPLRISRLYGVFINIQKNKNLQNKILLEKLRSTINSAQLVSDTKISAYPWSQMTITNSTITNTHDIVNESVDIATQPSSSLSLATISDPDLVSVAEYLQKKWHSVGITTKLRIYDHGEFKQAVIPERGFELLLFGQMYRHPTDAYAFWHSSQRLDPGLNISSFVSSSSDAILDRVLQNKVIDSDIDSLSRNISNSGVFIPLYIESKWYITPPELHGVSREMMTDATDRFNTVFTWSLKRHRVFAFDKVKSLFFN